MPFTNFPNGVTSFGIPSLGGGVQLSVPSGQRTSGTPAGTIWWVDVLNTGGPHTGANPSEAFQTIAAALAKAVSGDTIFVFPGTYPENVSVTVDYITLIGAQYAGYAKPDIGNTTGVALTVTGQGFRAMHCRFFNNDNTDVVIQTGNGYEYYDCFFDGNGTQTTKGLIRLLPSSTHTGKTASEGQIHGCYLRGCGGTAGALIMDTGAAPVGVGSTDNNIYDNIFTQNTAGPDIATAKSGAGGVYSVQFTNIGPRNQFVDKNKATYIDITTNEDGAAANQKGSINGNWFDMDTVTTTRVKMVGTGFAGAGNFSTVGVADFSGLD